MPRRSRDHSPSLDLTSDDRHAALVRLLAGVLVRIAQRRHVAAENPAESTLHLAAETLEDSGVSVLASGAGKSVHVQRG